MNKMNFPCPFDSSPFPEPDVLIALGVTQEKEHDVLPEVSTEDEESELESDGEVHQVPGEIIPTKRPLRQKPKRVKRPKFIKPASSTSMTTVKPVKPEEIFDKVEPVQRKIELKLTTVTEADISVEKTSSQFTEASGSFGLMFPVTKETDEQPASEEKKEDEKVATITVEELASNRISSRGKYCLAILVFYNGI